ncbi:MAG: tripartite tricarboxylate transporter permease [Candidatus Methylomirabilales bacterium]
MSLLELFALGLSEVFKVKVLFGLFMGSLAGIVAGCIPGFTIVMAVILTLPFTFGMTPVQGLATMIGVFVGGLSGGLITACLIGIPGTPSAIATTFDGYPMAKNGEPGRALALGVWASFWGGLLSGLVLMAVAPPLSYLALAFGPWEYFSLVLFAMTIIASLSGESLLKGLISAILGLLAAAVGSDPISNIFRFTFGMHEMEGGLDFLPILIGLFAFSNLMGELEAKRAGAGALIDVKAVRVPHLTANLEILFKQPWNLIRSSLLGLFVGTLPGAGSSISNIVSYDRARKASKHPERFGTGIPDGVIASEAGNSSTAGGALIPMIALGIPGDAVTAVMLGALIIHGIQPGPLLITNYPNLVYGMFVAFFFAHFMAVLIQSAAGLRFFLRLTFTPKFILVPVILILCAVGSFALNNRIFDIWVLFGFGILGYSMSKFGFPLAPLILGVILGPILETTLRRALMTDPNTSLFFTRPYSLTFLILAATSLLYPVWRSYRASPHPQE